MQPLIALHNVTKIYAMDAEPVPALQGITLNINPGEYVAIMGASGSGKSTLMNLIGCLDQPTSGWYVIDGRPIEQCTDDELASIRNATIGFVFQQFNLLAQMTALENVMLPLTYAGIPVQQRRLRAEYVLGLVGLSDRLHYLPNQLSGGQQQRVSIARALSNNPKLLLADEPTGALDSHTAAGIMGLIDELVTGGMTVIVVTHDPETASHAKRLIKVKDGLVISDSGYHR